MWHLAGVICCESWQIKENRASHALEISAGKRGSGWERAAEPDVPSRLYRLPKSCLRHGSREGEKGVSHSPAEVQALLQACVSHIGRRSMQKKKIKDYSQGRV